MSLFQSACYLLPFKTLKNLLFMSIKFSKEWFAFKCREESLTAMIFTVFGQRIMGSDAPGYPPQYPGP